MPHNALQALTVAMVPAAIFGMNLHSGWEVRNLPESAPPGTGLPPDSKRPGIDVRSTARSTASTWRVTCAQAC
jgi:hypothetical protein